MKDVNKRIKEKIDAEFAIHGYTYQMFEADRRQQKYHIGERNFFNSVLKNELEYEKKHLDLMLHKNEQLSRLMSDYVIHDKLKNKSFNSVHDVLSLKDFTLIHVIITNNYYSLKHHFLNGLTYQGLVLFRNTIELTELSICLLGDDSVHQFYRKEVNPSSKGGLYKSIKFGTLKSKTNAVIKWVKSLPNNNFPHEYWDEYLLIRQYLYDESSKYVHSNFESILENSVVKPIESKKIGSNDDCIMFNLGGFVSTQSKDRIKDVLLYESVSYLIWVILLIEKYKLPFKHFGKKANYMVALSKISLELVQEYLGQSKTS